MKNALIVAGLLVLLYIIYSLGSPAAPAIKTDTPQVKMELPDVEDYMDMDAYAKDEFMKGCIGDNSASEYYDYCECSYTEMRKDYNLTELIELDALSNDDALELMWPYIKLCLHHLE